MEKTKIPLYVHEILEKNLKPRLEKYDCWYKYEDAGIFRKLRLTPTPKLSFEIRAKKPYSDFFFKAKEEEKSNFFSITMSPFSERVMVGTNSEEMGHTIPSFISRWEDLLKRYDSLHSSFFDDPITQDYEDEFFNKWKIMEEDADTKPFDLQRQLLIDKYLEAAIQKLETLKTKENEKEIEALKAQANEIRQNLTRQTKNQVVRGLAKFWAMARKMGLDVLRDIFIDLASGVIQKMLLG